MDVLSIDKVLVPLSTSYVGDDDLAFTSRIQACEEGVALYKENYLLSAVDARINNYSSLYLTRKSLGEDIFSINKQPPAVKTELNATLYIPDTNSVMYLPVSNDERIIPTFSDKLDANTVFELDIIDDITLRIAHQRGVGRYYLHEIDGVFSFDTSKNKYPNTVFYYILNEEQLFLYRGGSVSKKAVRCKDNILQLVDFSSFTENYFRIERLVQHIKPTLNASWVSYDSISKNTLTINPSKSISNIPLNYLISNQYSYLTGNDIPSNFIALKNHFTNNNYNYRQNIIDKYNVNKPSVDRRDYTSLVTGCEQEKGDYSITLPFEFYTADYKFKADKYTIFKLPESLYPFDGINVNDAAINIAGAVGGDTPYTSDRIFFKDEDKFVADGQYLCTWLSATPGNAGMWVDRYYYPEQSTYIAALTSNNTNNQIDIIDQFLTKKLAPSAYYDVTYLYSSPGEELLHTPQTIRDALRNNFYFDKKSDLVFLPNKEYIYYRIGDRYVDEIVGALSGYLIQDGLTAKTSKNSTIINNSDEYIFDNNVHALVESFRNINDSKQATISFWIDSADWTVPVGHQILGNLSDRGFAIINDPIITPLIQIQDNLRILTLNSNFEVINTSYISPVDFTTLQKTVTSINYLYNTTTYYITAYFVKDIVRVDHLDTFLPVIDMYALSSLDQKSIFTEDGSINKITVADTCPVLLIDNPSTTTDDRLLADNLREKIGNIPLTAIVIEPCSLK